MIFTENLGNLLFELSNEDRLRILFKLQERAGKLTHISKKLKLNTQETSRHLSRLSEEKLILKNTDGTYAVTPYGIVAILLLPGFKFLSEYREYFITHTPASIPYELLHRIGELENCTFTDDIMISFHIVENMIQEAQEYVWILSDQILMSTQPLLEEAIKRDVEFRLILPEDMIPPPDFHPLPAIDRVIKRRTLKEVNAIIAVTEKKARVTFPNTNGKLDHLGFQTTDETARKWCKDFFIFYWKNAKIGEPKKYPKPNGR